jgi:ABC-2 type transport system ATP-binding protein
VKFQSPSLDDELSVRENLTCYWHMFGIYGGPLKKRVAELLDVFGLSRRAAERAKVLSGGLRRRVEIAKSMIHEPGVLLLDEPSTGLDPGARRDLMSVLTTLAEQGVTVFLTTHLMEEADPCDRVAIFDHGRLVALDAPEQLCRAIGGDVVTFETDDAQKLCAYLGENATATDGQVRIEHDAGHTLIASVIDGFPGQIRTAHVGRPTLADVFVHHTGHGLENGESSVGSES